MARIKKISGRGSVTKALGIKPYSTTDYDGLLAAIKLVKKNLKTGAYGDKRVELGSGVVRSLESLAVHYLSWYEERLEQYAA